MGTPELADQVREVPVRVLRAIFAGIGRMLLVADRMRGEAAGPGPSPATAEDQQDPLSSRADPPAGRARPRGDRSRWRSLDATGNVRLLTGDEEIDGENGSSESAQAADVTTAGAAAAHATEPAEQAAAVEPSAPAPGAAARPGGRAATSTPAPTRAPRSGRTAADREVTTGTSPNRPSSGQSRGERLPAKPGTGRTGGHVVAPPPGLPGYDELSVASLRARLRGLDVTALRAALAYERGHAARPEVITLFEHRIEKLTGAA